MVALAVGQAEQPFLEDGVFSVPQGQREAEKLLVVGDTRQPVFSPAVSAGTRLVVAEIVPGIAIVTVVLAHRAPLSFAQVRSPFLPGKLFLVVFFQPNLFIVHGSTSVFGHDAPSGPFRA